MTLSMHALSLSLSLSPFATLFVYSAYGWTRMSSVIAHGNTFCSVYNSYCLYSKGRNDINDNFRFARTPPIDLRPAVTAVKPSPAPLTGSLQCHDGLKPL